MLYVKMKLCEIEILNGLGVENLFIDLLTSFSHYNIYKCKNYVNFMTVKFM